MNRRLLLALVLSFVVFVGYGYLFAPKGNKTLEANSTKSVKQGATQATPQRQVQTSAASQSTSALSSKAEKLATIRSDRFTIVVDRLGRIAAMTLLEEKYKDQNGNALQIIDPSAVKPLELRFADVALNKEAFETPFVIDGKSDVTLKEASHTLRLTQKLSGVTVHKEITFQPSGAYSVTVKTDKPVAYFITPGYRPVADHSRYLVARGALVKTSDNKIKVIEDGEAKGDELFNGAKIVSAFDRYHASLFYDFDGGLDTHVLKTGKGDPLLFVKKSGTTTLHGYIGPKEYKVLTVLDKRLEDAIEFGWFTFLAKPFFKILHWIHDHIGNWGWAIILFTILVKAVLFPLTYKGMMSMQKLKDLAPKMKELREKYKDDPAKLNLKMMELYKKHGANPLGGCLPMLLQIPVFFALYRVLLNAVELQGAPWMLWIHDLSKMDPYYVLPVLMGASMWFQQRLTPSNFTDPMQEKIFKWFPVIMTVFFVTFPAGLVLYWLTSNLLTIAQQFYINKMYVRYKAAQVS